MQKAGLTAFIGLRCLLRGSFSDTKQRLKYIWLGRCLIVYFHCYRGRESDSYFIKLVESPNRTHINFFALKAWICAQTTLFSALKTIFALKFYYSHTKTNNSTQKWFIALKSAFSHKHPSNNTS